MKSSILDAAQGSLSVLGGVANLTMVAGFAWATVRLLGISEKSFSSAGGMPVLTTSHLLSLASDPALPSIASGYAVSWLALVGAAGCAFMTALGVRWTYHALTRLVLKLRG